jgi:hypothetical protein
MNRNAIIGFSCWLVLMATAFSSLTTAAFAQSYCVRAGATGTGTGLDWVNAMPALPATLVRGATYFIADGSYASYTFDDPASGSTVITIRKATQASHGTDTGWNTTYGDGQAVFNSPLNVNTPNWIFDGQVRNEANWFDGTGYGFKIAHNNQDNQIRMHNDIADNVQFRYIMLEASTAPLPSVTINRYGMYINDFDWNGLFTGHVISRCLFMNGNVPIFARTSDGTVVEYCAFADTESNDANHGEAISAYFGNNNFIFRHNKFRSIVGTAVLAYQGNGWQVYGNVMWDHWTGDGVIAAFSGGATANNNTFHHNTIYGGRGYNSGLYYAAGSTGNTAYNNLWINNAGPTSIDGAHNYNAFSDASNHGEANAQTSVSASILMDPANGDFRLRSATSPGLAIGAPYATDMTGISRGSDGTIDRGAYEFGGIVDTTPPVIASVAVSSVTSVSAVIGWLTTEPSTSVVEYGTTTSYGSTANNLSLVTNRAITLGSLTPNTLYNYRVRSADASGNVATSSNFTFITGLPDTNLPTVSLTSPANGLSVSNVVTLAATASDNVGVVGVKFFVEGIEVNDDTVSPYSFGFDTTLRTNGNYKIYSQARDAAGNIKWSGTNTITINNPLGALPASAVNWTFSENAGTISRDSDRDIPLTLRTGATWTTGRTGAGSAIAFDGVSGRADATNNAAYDYDGNTITVAAWVRLDNLNNWQQLVSKVTDVGTFAPPYFCWHLFAGTVSTTQWRPQFQLANTAQTGVNISSTVAVNYGEWVHIVGVYDGTAVRIYVNGLEQGNAAQTGNILRAPQPVYVGAHGLPGEFAKGAIDDIRIFSTALNASQIQMLYGGSSAVPRPTPPSNLRVASASFN